MIRVFPQYRRYVGKEAAALSLAMLLGGCALVDGKGGAGTEKATDPFVRAVKAMVDWIRAQSSDANRRFDYPVNRLDYRGSDAYVRLLATALRNDSVRFDAEQALARRILADPLFLRVVREIPVAAVGDAEMAALHHGDLDGAYYDGRIYLRRSKVDPTVATDPRPPRVLLVHEFLHAFGFGEDGESVALGAANGGRWEASTLTLPQTLRSLKNGDVINDLAAIIVLLSSDYLDGLAGDDTRPSSFAWLTLSDDDFGGPEGQTAPRQIFNLSRWFSGYEPFLLLNVQENGLYPLPGLVNRYGLTTRDKLTNFRVTATLVFPPVPEFPEENASLYPAATFGLSTGLSVGRFRSPTRHGLVLRSNQSSIVVTENGSADDPLVVQVQATALDRNLTYRVDGTVRFVAQLPGPVSVGVTLQGPQLDRLRLDTTVDTAQTPTPPIAGTPQSATWASVSDDDFGGPGGVSSAQQIVALPHWRQPNVSESTAGIVQRDGYMIPTPGSSGASYTLVSKDELQGFRLTFDVNFPPVAEASEGTVAAGFYVGRAKPSAVYQTGADAVYQYDFYDRKDAIGIARVRWPARRGLLLSAVDCNAFVPETVSETAASNSRIVIAAVHEEITVTIDGVLRCFYKSRSGVYDGSLYLDGFASLVDRLRLDRIVE